MLVHIVVLGGLLSGKQRGNGSKFMMFLKPEKEQTYSEGPGRVVLKGLMEGKVLGNLAILCLLTVLVPCHPGPLHGPDLGEVHRQVVEVRDTEVLGRPPELQVPQDLELPVEPHGAAVEQVLGGRADSQPGSTRPWCV